MDMGPWNKRETTDIIYHDAAGDLTAVFMDRGYLDRHDWQHARPRYNNIYGVDNCAEQLNACKASGDNVKEGYDIYTGGRDESDMRELTLELFSYEFSVDYLNTPEV